MKQVPIPSVQLLNDLDALGHAVPFSYCYWLPALKAAASNVLLFGLHVLRDKNNMTIHVSMCTKHFGLRP